MFAERHEHAGQGLDRGFHRFCRHGIALGDTRDCLADAGAKINQAFLFRRHLRFSRQFGTTYEVCQQQKKHTSQGGDIGSLLFFRAGRGGAPAPALCGDGDHHLTYAFRRKIRQFPQFLP